MFYISYSETFVGRPPIPPSPIISSSYLDISSAFLQAPISFSDHLHSPTTTLGDGLTSRTPASSPETRLQRIGAFRVLRMVGRNAAELQLSPPYRRLHPVFNVSLLMPAKDPSFTFLPEPADLALPHALGTSIARWIAVALILEHRAGFAGHEYLLRGSRYI
ncbi:hypothetical protein CROQUDRAFT_111451 [Cronartium quercuum f. sp. fusiforme G11]|uniref:Tf2-1-like SH3-like domain-containing protein n=1 Tax=Cronartium quercuum f. sp. fusiforme G11 TaxID=708437 RepID=A0A9P6N8M5_9BASI|nr:hypothetical protein CROQUDRAFT_111451 [Cronartium quercuum f. sp. fusiforme G11]